MPDGIACWIAGGSAIMAKVRPYIGTTTTQDVGQAAYRTLSVRCALMLLFSALLYWRGEQVAMGIRHFACRLAAKRGVRRFCWLPGDPRRGGSVVVTALVPEGGTWRRRRAGDFRRCLTLPC